MSIKNPIGLGPGLPPVGGGNRGYLGRILAVEPGSLVGAWTQDEASGLVSFDHSGKKHNGLYTGATLGSPGVPGMGLTCPTFDGVEDFNDIYSASLNVAFNGAEGTLLVWAKVADADVWEDGSAGFMAHIGVDAQNYIYIVKSSVNNTIVFQYEAGDTKETQLTGSLSNIDFACYAMTWSKSGDTVIYYIDGAASGSADTGLGTWVGDLSNSATVVGASTTAPASVFTGSIGPVLLSNKAYSADQIAYVSKV